MAEPDPPRRRRSTSPMDVDDLERAGKQHAHCESQSPTPERGPAVDAPVIPEPLHARHHALHPPRRSHSISPPPDFQPPADPGHSYPVYFYHRHNPYFEFTNFSPHAIEWDGHVYRTAEHLFQAHKFMVDRPDLVTRIRHLRTSREALEEAGRLRRLQRSDWFDVNVGIMDDILYAKFTQHPRLKASLLGTGERELIEDSPVDSFWGCGSDRKGRNELGKALMRLRDKLRYVY